MTSFAHCHLLVLELKSTDLALALDETEELIIVDHLDILISEGCEKLHEVGGLETTDSVEDGVDEIISLTRTTIG